MSMYTKKLGAAVANAALRHRRISATTLYRMKRALCLLEMTLQVYEKALVTPVDGHYSDYVTRYGLCAAIRDISREDRSRRNLSNDKWSTTQDRIKRYTVNWLKSMHEASYGTVESAGYWFPSIDDGASKKEALVPRIELLEDTIIELRGELSMYRD